MTGSAAGRDRRAVRHVAPAGAPTPACCPGAPARRGDGGGIAGLAAATGLAERGVRVTLVEREPYLGGRAGGWTEASPARGLAMSRGFHAFFRQYYNLRALLRRADPGPGPARPARPTTRWSTRTAGGTASAACPAPRRGTRWPSRCAARRSGPGT